MVYKIKASDKDEFLNNLDKGAIFSSNSLKGDQYRNIEIIRLLEIDGCIIIRNRYETSNKMDISITDKGLYLRSSGGYLLEYKRKRKEKIKLSVISSITFLLGLFIDKLLDVLLPLLLYYLLAELN